MSSSSNGHQNHHNGPSTSSSSMHCCEICGQSGFTDDKMLEHTQKCHVEGKSECPFCGMTDASSAAELLLHVNQAHLDYLTPENELMSFIDDSKSPSDDSDSVSLFDFIFYIHYIKLCHCRCPVAYHRRLRKFLRE